MTNKKFTKGQLKLEKLLNELGFQTILEYRVGNYFIDVFVPEVNMGFEFDSRWHIGQKGDFRRDMKIKEYSSIKIMRVREENFHEIQRLKEKIIQFVTKRIGEKI